MGRDTTGVRGMDVGKDGQVIAMDVARDDMDLLVVTENGYGKRTADQPVPQDQPRRQRRQDDRPDREKGRPRRARSSCASTRSWSSSASAAWSSARPPRGISQQGRSATGVRVMNLKDDDLVSAVALVVDTGEDAAPADGGARGGRGAAEVEPTDRGLTTPRALAPAAEPARTPRSRSRRGRRRRPYGPQLVAGSFQPVQICPLALR